MEKHNVKSEMESCHDIYRNYLRKTQSLPAPIEGFNPTDRKEWIAAKKAAKFYHRKVSRELKKSRAEVSLLTSAHYKFARLNQQKKLLELKLEFCLAIQHAIEVSKSAQTGFAEVEITQAKENLLHFFESDPSSFVSTATAATSNSKKNKEPQLQPEANYVTKDYLTMNINPINKPPKTVLSGLQTAENSSTDTSSVEDRDVIKPINDDLEFDALYASGSNNNSGNNSRNYTDSEVDALVKAAMGENPIPQQAPQEQKSVPSMNNPLRGKSFHVPKVNVEADVSANKTSGGQLANKIRTAEPRSNMSRSMHNIPVDGLKSSPPAPEKKVLPPQQQQQPVVKQVPAPQTAQSSSRPSFQPQLSQPTPPQKQQQQPVVVAEAKTPVQAAPLSLHTPSEGKPAQKIALTPVFEEKVFELSSPEESAPEEKKKGKNPIKSFGKAIGKMFSAPEPHAHTSQPTTPKAQSSPPVTQPPARSFGSFFGLKSTSSEDLEHRKPAATSPKVQTAPINAKDHIINTTYSFAEARRYAKVQQTKNPKAANAQQQRNEHVVAVIAKSGEAEAIKTEPVTSPTSAASTAPSSANSRPVSTAGELSPLAQRQQQLHEQQQQLNSTSGPPAKGSIEVLKSDKEDCEKLMKICDDLVAQAKACENKYNTMPNLWSKVNESWEECVKFCEKQFDCTSDRFKNDWNRRLTVVIKEKHRWGEKMKRLQEYDYVRDGTSSTSNVAAISNNNINAVPAAAAAAGPNMSETSSNTAANRNSTANNKSSSLPNYSRPQSSTQSGPLSPSSSSSASRPQSNIAASTTDNVSIGEPTKVEKLQDKLQRNKVKALLDKAFIVTNSAKYELSKKAIHDAKQAWQDCINLYEQSYLTAPEAFKEHWSNEIKNVKKMREESISVVVDKQASVTSSYNMNVPGKESAKNSTNNNDLTMDGANLSVASDLHGNNSYSNNNHPNYSIPNYSEQSNHSANHSHNSNIKKEVEKQDRSIRKGAGDLQIGVQFDGEYPNSSANYSSSQHYIGENITPKDISVFNKSGPASNNGGNSNRNSVNFHRVRVG
jgi:hypothetical protein